MPVLLAMRLEPQVLAAAHLMFPFVCQAVDEVTKENAKRHFKHASDHRSITTVARWLHGDSQRPGFKFAVYMLLLS